MLPLEDELKADDVLSVYAELNTTGGGGGGMAAAMPECGGGGGGGGGGMACWERGYWSVVECMLGRETRWPTDGYEYPVGCGGWG